MPKLKENVEFLCVSGRKNAGPGYFSKLEEDPKSACDGNGDQDTSGQEPSSQLWLLAFSHFVSCFLSESSSTNPFKDDIESKEPKTKSAFDSEMNWFLVKFLLNLILYFIAKIGSILWINDLFQKSHKGDVQPHHDYSLVCTT